MLEGPENPLSYPMAGLPDTVSNITLEDVKAFYNAHVPQHMSAVLVSTSLPQEELLQSLQGLAGLEVKQAIRPALATLRPEIEGRTVYLVNKEGAAQSSIRTGQHALRYDALGDFYKANLANFILGGTFNSRINLNLREDKGYTYGARTGFSGGPEMGSFSFSSEVNKDATAASISEVITELEAFDAGGMTEEEFDFMRSAIGQRDARSYETPGSKLGLLANIAEYDLPLNYRTQQNTLLREVDRETLNEVASRLIDPDNMAIVVVGDEDVIRPELEALGMPIVELNEDGFRLEAGAN